MVRLTLILTFLLIATIAYGQKRLAGEYIVNFSSYGMFGKILKLNCDSSAVLSFKGDLMNDNSYGRWTMRNKMATVVFDTTKHNARYKDTLNFRIKGKRLYEVGWTKAMHNRYQALIDQHNKETGEKLHLPSLKLLTQAPKNFHGKTGKQYFKKLKAYSCGK